VARFELWYKWREIDNVGGPAAMLVLVIVVTRRPVGRLDSSQCTVRHHRRRLRGAMGAIAPTGKNPWGRRPMDCLPSHHSSPPTAHAQIAIGCFHHQYAYCIRPMHATLLQ